MSKRRKFKSGGSESEVTIDPNKKYKWDSKGDFVEYTGDAGDNEITVSGSKSSLRRMADIERNIAILATTLTTTDDGVTDSDSTTFSTNVNKTTRFKKGVRIDASLNMRDTIDMNGDKITEVGTPTATTDAANKAYVDSAETDAISTAAATAESKDVARASTAVSNIATAKSEAIASAESKDAVRATAANAYADAAVAVLTAGASASLDTLLEISNVMATDTELSDSIAALNHDSLSGFVANEHIDWTADQGATNIHAGNYTDTNTTYSVQDGELSQVSFTTADNTKLDGIDTSANNYSHPSHPGDDMSVDTGALTGATVVSDIDINVTTDTSGHVTDANGTVSTRTLTLANLGYTGSATANNYSHPINYAGDDFSIDTGALTGATVVSDIDINVTTDTSGHVTDANGTVSTRTLTLANLGYTGDANANNYSLPASVVHDTESGALHASNALSISGHTISLNKGDGTSETVVVPDNNTTYSVGNGGLTQINFTTADNSKLDGIDTSANNYSLPASVVHNNEKEALHGTDALSISGHTITLRKGNNTVETVTVPDNNTETTTTISHNTSTKTLSYVNELGATTNIDLTQYVDDTNLARLTSGSLNSSTGLATFTRDDSTTFTIDMSSFFDDTNTWRGIDNTPVNGVTTESISSNWAYDHYMSSTAHPRDTRNQIAGTYNNYSHPITAGNKHVPTGGASGQFLKYSASGTAVWATPSYTTNTDTNTTYTAGNGLGLSGTSFSMDGQYSGNFVVSGDITAQGGDMTATRFNGQATTAKYADLAERYAADAPYEEGTVVMFGGEAEVTSTQGYGSTKIAGVVSIKPAFAMNEAAGNSETHPYIALQGRVPCKVIGPVSKGDILVASEVTGVATVWLDDATDPRMTAYIGIAIEDKASDTAGYVEVKVGK